MPPHLLLKLEKPFPNSGSLAEPRTQSVAPSLWQPTPAYQPKSPLSSIALLISVFWCNVIICRLSLRTVLPFMRFQFNTTRPHLPLPRVLTFDAFPIFLLYKTDNQQRLFCWLELMFSSSDPYLQTKQTIHGPFRFCHCHQMMGTEIESDFVNNCCSKVFDFQPYHPCNATAMLFAYFMYSCILLIW